jgi:hypothetical protein
MGLLLSSTERREFINTVNNIERLGGRNIKFIKPRRQKLRGIVQTNKQIWGLYNAYARTQSATQKRVTYRLPVFEDLVEREVEEDVEMGEAEGGVGGGDAVEDELESRGDTEDFHDAMEIQDEPGTTDAVDEEAVLPSVEESGTVSRQERTGHEESDNTWRKSPGAAAKDLGDNASPSTPAESIDTEMVDADSPCQAASLRKAPAPPIGLFAAPSPVSQDPSATPDPIHKKVQFQNDLVRQPFSPTSTIPAGPSSPTRAVFVDDQRTLTAEPTSPIRGSSIDDQRTLTAEPSTPVRAASFDNRIATVEPSIPYCPSPRQSPILDQPSSPIRASSTASVIPGELPRRSAAPSPTHTVPIGPSSPIQAPSVESSTFEPSSPATVEHATQEAAEPVDLFLDPPSEDHRYIIPIINPEDFPTKRIQVIQALRYPSARVVEMWSHRSVDGEIVQITADMQDGPVNHLVINDARIITALGLRDDGHDVISRDDESLRLDETFTISIHPGQRPKNVKNFVVGEMRTGRHAYLHWLDSRGTADPKRPPYPQEANRIAVQLGRRAMDVWKEIEGYWELEQGAAGKLYRVGRLKYLGEDPVYCEEDEKKASVKAKTRSMWG